MNAFSQCTHQAGSFAISKPIGKSKLASSDFRHNVFNFEFGFPRKGKTLKSFFDIPILGCLGLLGEEAYLCLTHYLDQVPGGRGDDDGNNDYSDNDNDKNNGNNDDNSK